MSPLKCIRLRSHAASEFEGERIEAYAVQSARTDRRIEKYNVLRNCTDCLMYYGATRATRFAILIPELPRVRLCAMRG